MVVLSRLIGESKEVGEDGADNDESKVDLDDGVGDDDGDDGVDDNDDDDREIDSGDEERSKESRNFLLFIPLSAFPNLDSLVMKSLILFTSANFTGFTMKSSAPSSKHLKNSIHYSQSLRFFFH